MPLQKEGRNWHLTAKTWECLEIRLTKEDFNTKTRRVDLIIDCAQILPLTWELITASEIDDEDLTILINSNRALLARTNRKGHYQIDLYATFGKVGKQAWVRIETSNTNEEMVLKATDIPSASYLMSLVRKDVAHLTEAGFIEWVVFHGFTELNLLGENATVIEMLNTRLANCRMPKWHWSLLNGESRPDIASTYSTRSYPEFLIWLAASGLKEHQLPLLDEMHLLQQEQRLCIEFRDRSFGVNLIGLEQEDCGIGEDMRNCYKALKAARIPTQKIAVSNRNTNIELRRAARESSDLLAPFAINIFCLTAEDHGRILLELGSGIITNRYNIGYWPWEFTIFPQELSALCCLIDEAWAISSFTGTALANMNNTKRSIPMLTMPSSSGDVSRLDNECRHRWRKHFDLPEDEVLIISVFDARSSFDRKNPWAAIECFERWRRSTRIKARLVIKVMHAEVDMAKKSRLYSVIAQSGHIHLIDGILDRTEVLGLLGSCDIFISLHRSEGFGRLIAESLQMGLEVVCTGYGGNVDYCAKGFAKLVDNDLVAVMPKEYPYHEGLFWAEPCMSDAVLKLRLAAQRVLGKVDTKELTRSRAEYFQEYFGLTRASSMYKERLQSIWENRHKLSNRLAHIS